MPQRGGRRAAQRSSRPSVSAWLRRRRQSLDRISRWKRSTSVPLLTVGPSLPDRDDGTLTGEPDSGLITAIESTRTLPTSRAVFSKAKIMHVMDGVVEVETEKDARLLTPGASFAVGGVAGASCGRGRRCGCDDLRRRELPACADGLVPSRPDKGAATLAGAAQGLGQLAGLTLIATNVPSIRRAEANAAALNIAGYVPAAILPVATGYLIDVAGLTAAVSMFATILAIASLTALVGVRWSTRTTARTQRLTV